MISDPIDVSTTPISMVKPCLANSSEISLPYTLMCPGYPIKYNLRLVHGISQDLFAPIYQIWASSMTVHGLKCCLCNSVAIIIGQIWTEITLYSSGILVLRHLIDVSATSIYTWCSLVLLIHPHYCIQWDVFASIYQIWAGAMTRYGLKCCFINSVA